MKYNDPVTGPLWTIDCPVCPDTQITWTIQEFGRPVHGAEQSCPHCGSMLIVQELDNADDFKLIRKGLWW